MKNITHSVYRIAAADIRRLVLHDLHEHEPYSTCCRADCYSYVMYAVAGCSSAKSRKICSSSSSSASLMARFGETWSTSRRPGVISRAPAVADLCMAMDGLGVGVRRVADKSLMSPDRISGVLVLEPLTASTSAATLPGWLACPFNHFRWVSALHSLRSAILARTGSMRSLFSTSFPPDVFQLRPIQLSDHFVRQFMEYEESVQMIASRSMGI